MAEPRTYVVGLPVLLTVHDDGRVEYAVDFAEAARDLGEHSDPDEIDDDTLEADVDRVDQWATKNATDTTDQKG